MKSKNAFECQSCGARTIKWLGRCPSCNSWDSIVEVKVQKISAIGKSTSKATPITKVEAQELKRFSSGEEEFDLSVGGGIVMGGLYLIGGSPGVGKSTLMLKISLNLSLSGLRVLYVSGEESNAQIKSRAQRLGELNGNLHLFSEINLARIEEEVKNYDLCIIDSIQTIFSENFSSSPGSMTQVREVTFTLMRMSKELNISIFIIGHVTKEGSISGPKVLEHMVDCVLYFEGDNSREIRILRTFKNRFGPSNEVGIFEMKAQGLISLKDAQRAFFNHRKALAGSALSVIFEGSRTMIIEIEALVAKSNFPKRSATGFELNRLNMLVALLERKLEIPLWENDIFINVVGGVKIQETGADLALIAALLSSFNNRALANTTAFIGEVSLVGEIRGVHNLEARLKELSSSGFSNVIIPHVDVKPKTKLKLYQVDEVQKLLDWM